jgi:hypothetical protein
MVPNVLERGLSEAPRSNDDEGVVWKEVLEYGYPSLNSLPIERVFGPFFPQSVRVLD